MNTYAQALASRLKATRGANFPDNHDHRRFGQRKCNQWKELIRSCLDGPLEKLGFARKDGLIINEREFADWLPLSEDLDWLYSLFSDDESRSVLVDVIAFRLLGNRKVCLPLNTPAYWRELNDIESRSDGTNLISIEFNDWQLPLNELTAFGYPVKLYARAPSVMAQFILEQYACETIGAVAKPGDIVIDAGGCFGDTAIYFAHRVGVQGHVYTFEFVNSNVDVLQTNLDLNTELNSRVTIAKFPLWDQSDITLFVSDNGPGSIVSTEKIGDESKRQEVSTITIDDYVSRNQVERIDFIKMDIEGAEFPALQGALQTIRNHRPTLALCVYHSPKDFVRLAKLIDEQQLGYRFSLRHFTIHAEETVLFASVEEHAI